MSGVAPKGLRWNIMPDVCEMLGIELVDGAIADQRQAAEAIHRAIAPPPLQRPGPRFLYVVELVGVGVKVGISDSPRKRVRQHVGAARAFGVSVGRVWVSVAHDDARFNECELVGEGGTEWLRETFDDVVGKAGALVGGTVWESAQAAAQ